MLASVAESASGVFSAIGEIDQLRTENASLRDENERLENENARLEALKAENDEMSALLQLQSGFDHETVAVRVIGRELLENRRIVTIDKGTDDGLELNDIVVVQGGALAGRITDVGPTFAKVTLVSDASATVVGQLVDSGSQGDIVRARPVACWSCATSTRRSRSGSTRRSSPRASPLMAASGRPTRRA